MSSKQNPDMCIAGIQNMTMFCLYRAWSQANPIFTRLCEGRFNITRREWRILATAVTHPALSSAALAEATGLDTVRTSRTIGTLCHKGWIERERDKVDARLVFIKATPDGIVLYRQIIPIITDLNDQIAQDLSPDELHALHRALDKIATRAQTMLDIDVIHERPRRGYSRKEAGLRLHP